MLRIWLWLLAAGLGSGLHAQAVFTLDPDLRLGDTTQLHVLETQRGDRILGFALSLREASLLFRLRASPDTASFPLRDLRALYVYDSIQHALPPGGTYGLDLLYTQTGRREAGRGSYRNILLLYNAVDLYLGDHFTAGLGYLAPLLFDLRLRGQFDFGPHLRLGIVGVGALSVVDIDGGAAFHLYPNLTYGSDERFVSAGIGYGRWEWEDQGAMVFQFGGAYRIDERWRVYSDSYVVVSDFATQWLPTVMFSHFPGRTGRSRLDFGLLALPNVELPILPLAAFVRYF